MNNFGTLYGYECKKLFRKKMVWISLTLCIITVAFSLIAPILGGYYVDGKLIDTNYNMYKEEKHYADLLDGREINQELIQQTVDAYRKIPATTENHYTLTQEYQQYARQYSEIFNFIRGISGMETSEIMRTWHANEDDMYAKRQAWLTSMREDMKLSNGEIQFWESQEEKIVTPYVYQKHNGYSTLLSSYQTVGIIVLMLIAICLSGIFSNEHTRKTDQIILSSTLGKTQLYRAKIMAGISFAVIITVLFLTTVFLTTVYLYGTENFNAAFQLIYFSNSNPISCGQAILISYVNMIITAVFVSVFVMVLSELLHSNIATVAVLTALTITPMVLNVPEHYRVLSQIWDWFPWRYLAPWSVFGNYTLCIFGHYLTSWQAVPIIYIFISAIITFIGKPIYKRFQVSGR